METPRGLKRKVIRIKAEDSPNVRLAMAEIAAGREPSSQILIYGVKQWLEYKTNRRDWDAHQQCVSLDADWYEGAEVLMYPPEWLNFSEQRAEELRHQQRTGIAIGVDTGEGTAETALAVVDEHGLIELESRRTPDTSEIPGWVLSFARKHSVAPEKILFDRGGGGYEHACVLRRMGYPVRTIPFGAILSAPIKPRGVVSPINMRRELEEEKYAYKNRRAEMYHLLRLRIDPRGKAGFSIPREYTELRRQLAPVPLWYDEEGRIWLPPKQTRPGEKSEDKITMTKLLGCSPDQSDALVLAVYGTIVRDHRFRISKMTA